MRASLVRGQSLSQLARRLQLGETIRLGSGERKSGGRRRDSILADAMEAVIGAIFLDGGMAACQSCITSWLESELASVNPNRVDKDPKTTLQEWLQREKKNLPVYRVLEVLGPAHQQTFRVQSTRRWFRRGSGGDRCLETGGRAGCSCGRCRSWAHDEKTVWICRDCRAP